jgi:hypothetical protein
VYPSQKLSSLYNFRSDCRENTVSNSSSVSFLSLCLLLLGNGVVKMVSQQWVHMQQQKNCWTQRFLYDPCHTKGLLSAQFLMKISTSKQCNISRYYETKHKPQTEWNIHLVNEQNITIQRTNNTMNEMFEKMTVFKRKLWLWELQMPLAVMCFPFLRTEKPTDTKKYTI